MRRKKHFGGENKMKDKPKYVCAVCGAEATNKDFGIHSSWIQCGFMCNGRFKGKEVETVNIMENEKDNLRENGYRDSEEHLRYIIAELEKAFVAIPTVTKGHFGDEA